MGSFIDQDKRTATSDKRFFNETANDRWMGLSSTCRRIVCIFQKEKEKDVKKNQDEEINKEIVKSVISRGIPVEKFFELGGEIIKLDTSPNSTHVNVFEMAGIDPKKVEENTKLINDLINSYERITKRGNNTRNLILSSSPISDWMIFFEHFDIL